MTSRFAVFAFALAFMIGFAFLTVKTIAEQGLTVAGALSVGVLALLAVGVIGALRHPPR